METVYFILVELLLLVTIQSSFIPLYPQCKWLIIVDRTASYGCENYNSPHFQVTCNNLKDVFLFLRVSINTTNSEVQNCTEIVLKDGEHVIEGVKEMVIHESVFLHNSGRERVKVNLIASIQPIFKVFLSFQNATFVVISGVDFVSVESDPISFENVLYTQIIDSSFRSFPQGAVDIYNCPNILVTDCSFHNNGPVTSFKTGLWRGHAGGLSIAFYSVAGEFEAINVTLTHNDFNKNTANPKLRESRFTTTNLLINFIFSGRGGGCAININTPTSSDVTVRNCTFRNNYALAFGGGLYLAFGVVANHSVIVQDSQFIENQTPGGAGGLEIGFAKGGSNDIANRVLAVNVTFLKNTASYGGGSFVFIAGQRQGADESGNLVEYIECTFTENSAMQYGGAIGMLITASSLIFGDRENFISVEINSCKFLRNNGGRGATVTTNYMPVHFSGSTHFTSNKGIALTVIGSKILLDGMIVFEHNAAVGEGGALYAVSLGQLLLSKDARLVFINNTASLGASIVVQSLYIPRLYAQLVHNPLCVFLFEEKMPSETDDPAVVAYFSGNKALVGSGVYTNNIDSCSWTGKLTGAGDNFHFNPQLAFRWKFFNYSADNKNRAHCPDSYNPDWYVQTEEVKLDIPNKEFSVYPGESIHINVNALDELNLETVSFLRLSDGISLTPGNQTSMIRLYPSTFSLNNVNDSSSKLSLNIRSSSYQNSKETIVFEPTRGQPVKVSIELLGCPYGYTLVKVAAKEEYICNCNIQNKYILSCNESKILLSEGYWSSATTISIYPCPYKFCKCSIQEMGNGRFVYLNMLNTSNPDSQCSCGRQGILCGSCNKGRGYSAIFNKCITCSGWSGLWIMALIISDVAVFMGLLLLGVKLPSYLIPCIFYLQTLPIMAEFFPCSFEDFYKPLGLITSALSFYFIYDFCLGPRMDPRVVYFLRYSPLLTILLILPVVLACLRCCKNYRKRSLFYYKKISSGLFWWIINFSFVHITNTSMEILRCPNIHINEDMYSKRWTISGEIECFKGDHLPLAMLAIIMLLLCALLVPTITVVTLSRADLLKRYANVLSYPYKSTFKWWLAADFAKRFLLLLVNTIFTSNNYPLMLLLSVNITFHGMLMPYSNDFTNILEVILASIVLILLLFRNTSRDNLDTLIGINRTETTNESCSFKRREVSPASYILMVLYYLPLVITVVGIVYWMTIALRSYLIKKAMKADSRDYKEAGTDMSYYRLSDVKSNVNAAVPTISELSQYL